MGKDSDVDFQELFGVGLWSEKPREEADGEERRKQVNNRPAKSAEESE